MTDQNQPISQEAVKEEKPIKNGSKSELYQEKPGGKFKEGNPGGGKPKGSQSFSTLFKDTIKKIAKDKILSDKLKSKGVDITKLEKEIVIKAILQALGGSYHHFRDIMDRIYGKPKETIAIEDEVKIIEIKELVLTTRKILELKLNGAETLPKSTNIGVSQEQIQE